LAELISDGTFTLNTQTVPLARVSRAWSVTARADKRIVIQP
jgi:hypothetical protein